MSEMISGLAIGACGGLAMYALLELLKGQSTDLTKEGVMYKPKPLAPELHLRMMNIGDIPRIMEIECDSFNEPWTQREFKTLVKDKHHLCGVAVINSKVVGYIIYELRKSAVYLKSLAVTPNFRRQRIGTKMVEQMLELMEQTNRYSCRIHLAETNLLAQKFFRAIGFKATAVCRNFYDEMDAYYFIKRLPRPAGAVSGTKANG